MKVNSAAEMFEACASKIEACDIAIFSAAVSDFTPVKAAGQKVKRGEHNWELELEPTRDIAAEMGKRKQPGQLFVGFALETEKGLEHALTKLERKNLDMIVLNMAGEEGSGFGSDTNRVTFIDRSGGVVQHELKAKSQVADDLVERLKNLVEPA